MTTLEIPVSPAAAPLLGRISPQDWEALRKYLSGMLELELKKIQPPQAGAPSTGLSFSLRDFQEAMGMTDEDMVLTFGLEYLQSKNWPGHYEA